MRGYIILFPATYVFLFWNTFPKPHDPQIEKYAIQSIIWFEEESNLLRLPEVHHTEVGVPPEEKNDGSV